MSAENKALVRRYVEEVLNKRNLTVIDELFAPTFIDHDSAMPQARGRRGQTPGRDRPPQLSRPPFHHRGHGGRGGQGGLSLLGTRHPPK